MNNASRFPQPIDAMAPRPAAAPGAQGVFRLNSAGMLAYVDARAVEIVGYAPDELLGRHFTTVLFEEDRARGQGHFDQRRNGIGGVSEYRLRRKDGSPVWATVASVPTFDEGGVFLGTTGFITDIDTRHRQQELTDHNLRLLRQVAANYPLTAVMDDLCVTLERVSRRPLRATVMLKEDDHLRCVAAPGLPPDFSTDRNATSLDGSGTACAEAVRSGMKVIVADTARDGVAPEIAVCRQNWGFGAVWSYPIIQDGQTLGTLALLPSDPGEPDAEDELVIGFALQVARLALARERDAQALRGSEQRFRDYAELSADWFWEQDAEFRFTEMTGGVYNKGGFRVGRALGRTRWELPIEGVGAEQWAAHRALLERRETFRDFTYTIRNDAGELRWYAVSGKPVFGPDGAFAGYRGIGRDITEQVAVSNKLEKTQRWLEQAVRAANLGLWERDADTWAFHFTSNWKSLFGYAEDEIDNKAADFDCLIHPDDLARIQAVARAYVENPQGAYENRFRVRHKDGTWRWVLSRGSLVANPFTGRRTWMGCHIDITAQQQAEEALQELTATLETRVKARTAALEEANRELDAFNFSVSHDLRTPLRAIEGFSQALIEDSHDRLDEAGRDALQRIVAATRRMGDLIEALYDLARLSRTPLHLRTVDLSALARELVSELRNREPERAVAIEIAGTPAAEGDARLLRIVLANLLGNAWKYTIRTVPAHIVFGARRDDRGCSVYFVRDNGAGFDMRFADKLFKLFHRLHREEEFGGQGVGLATVQRIVHRHGGRIWAEAARGAGATFFFTLWENDALRSETAETAEAAHLE